MVARLSYRGISSELLVQEAKKEGLSVEILSEDKNLFYIKSDKKEILFKSTDFGVNSSFGFKIADDKELTYKLLERNNFPTANSIYLSSVDNLNKKVKKKGFSFPVVIKPIDEGHGNGVLTNISSIKELEGKLELSIEKYGNMIVQEQIEGDEFRVLVFGEDIIYAINRIPAHIVCDGKNTIEELINIENKNPLRGEGYNNPLSFIVIDDELVNFIKKQGLSLDSVVEKGKTIYLRGNSNVGSGGIIKNVTDILNKDVANICIRASKFCGLGFCGVDIITSDISKPLSETGGIILELNATPGLGGDKKLVGVNSAEMILKKIFK